MKKIFVYSLMCLVIIMCGGCTSNKEKSNSVNDVAINYLNGLSEQNFELMDKSSIVEYETIHRAMIEQAMREYEKTEAEIYKMILGNDIENPPETYQEYKDIYIKNFRKDLKEEYGEKYSIDTTIISSEDITAEDKSDILKEASDYYDQYGIIISNIIDFANINEIKKVQCKVYINGENGKSTTEDFSVYIVKVNKEWKVLNLGTGG